MNSNIGRFSHVIAAIEPTQQLAAFADYENGGADTVDRDDLSIARNCQSGHDVDVSDRDLLQKVTALGEDLHAGPFVSSVANHVFAAGPHDGHLSGVPQLTLFFSGDAELELELSGFLEHLNKN